MVVEDEAIIVLLIKNKLMGAGFNSIYFFAEGNRAIEESQNINPDFIIMDINLVGSKDGIEVAKEILEMIFTKFIFITGYHIDNIENRIKDLTPIALLIKPINMEKLIECIN